MGSAPLPESLSRIEAIRALHASADHWDAYTVRVEASLSQVISAALSYHPWWVDVLFRVRGVVARVLRLQHDGVAEAWELPPEQVRYEPGAPASFFTVHGGEEGRYWVAGAEDRHLAAQLAFIAEPMAEGPARYHLVTFVHYRDWTGPLYFNLILPFHHLIVFAMARSVRRSLGAAAAEPGPRRCNQAR